jgi:hypothetical protein
MATTSHFTIRLGDYLATLIFVALALGLMGYEFILSPWTARGKAKVTGPVHRIARGAGDLTMVVLLSEPRPAETTLRTWFHHPQIGSIVRVRYNPRNLEEVALDDFWQLHYPSVIALGICVFAVWVETARLNYRWRLRHSELVR